MVSLPSLTVLKNYQWENMEKHNPVVKGKELKNLALSQTLQKTPKFTPVVKRMLQGG